MRTFGLEDELEPDLVPLVQLCGAGNGAGIWYRLQQNLGPVQETTDNTIRGMTREKGKTRPRTGTAGDSRDARPGQNLFFFKVKIISAEKKKKAAGDLRQNEGCPSRGQLGGASAPVPQEDTVHQTLTVQSQRLSGLTEGQTWPPAVRQQRLRHLRPRHVSICLTQQTPEVLQDGRPLSASAGGASSGWSRSWERVPTRDLSGPSTVQSPFRDICGRGLRCWH